MSRIDNIKTDDNVSSVTRLTNEESTTQELIEKHIKSVNADFTPKGHPFSYFFHVIDKAIELKQDSEGIDEDKRLLFTEDVPPETINTRAITYFLKSRVPGRIDRGPAGIGSIKAVRPILRRVRPNPNAPGEEIETYIQPYDNWVNFFVYARSSNIAMETLLWFEDLMLSSNPLFEAHGFKVIPEGVGDREVIQLETLKLIRYPMSYAVRHEKLFNVASQTTKHINVDTGIKI